MKPRKFNYVMVAGTEFWIRVAKSEIKVMEQLGYKMTPDKRKDGVYWTIQGGD